MIVSSVTTSEIDIHSSGDITKSALSSGCSTIGILSFIFLLEITFDIITDSAGKTVTSTDTC